MKFIFLFFLFYLFCLPLLAQDFLEQKEIALNEKLLQLRAAKTDDEMNRLNLLFKVEMKAFLETDGVFEYHFKHLKTVAILDSPDKTLRIVNWNIEYADISFFYCAFVMHWDSEKEIVRVTELIDNLDPYTAIPEGIIDSKNWYGALYYKILPFERNSKVEYVLLGWDGGTTLSNYKLIDVLTFNGNLVKLGSPVFQQKKSISNRVVFEYADNAKMSLLFESKYKKIVFDHLSPESEGLEGVYSYYLPDMSYDSYYYHDEMWILKEDVIAINDKDKITQNYNEGKEGKQKKKQVKKKWNNPNTQKNSSDIGHVSRMPDNEGLEEEKIQVLKKNKKKSVKKKDHPSKMSITTGKQKIRKKKYKN